MMEAVIFVGIQVSGKSTFRNERFVDNLHNPSNWGPQIRMTEEFLRRHFWPSDPAPAQSDRPRTAPSMEATRRNDSRLRAASNQRPPASLNIRPLAVQYDLVGFQGLVQIRVHRRVIERHREDMIHRSAVLADHFDARLRRNV